MNLTFGRAALAALPMLLAGCGILSGPPERPIYRLHPQLAFAAALPRVGEQLVVALPSAPAGLDTARIALSRTPVSLDYFADAQWDDRVPFLVQSALVDGFEKSGAIKAVGTEHGGFRPDYVLDAAVGDFTAIYDAPSGPPRVAVKLNVKLVRASDRRVVDQTAVAREASAAANTLPDIVAAYDRALGGAVTEIVGWTLGNRVLAARGGRP